MERNYTAAVRAINADSRKRHLSQVEVVIPCPPPKTGGDSEDFIPLNFESENEDGKGDGDDSDEDCDKEDSGGYPLSEDLKTTQTSISEDDKENESEDGISEKTRSRKRRKDRSDRKGSAVGERKVGGEALRAVAENEELVAAPQSIDKSAPPVTIEIKSSPSSSSGRAYQHEADEDKDSTTRRAQQQQQRKLTSAAASSSSRSAIAATSPISLSSARTRAGTNTSKISSSPDPRSQLVAKKTTAEVPQGGKDLSSKALRKLEKREKRREKRRVERTCRKAALEQKEASIDHPRRDSFSSVPSDVDGVGKGERETNGSRDEGLEINLAQEGEGHIQVKEEEGGGGGEDLISLSAAKAPVSATSGRSILPLSFPLSSSFSPSPTPATYNKSSNSDGQDKHRQSQILIDRKTVMFQLRYHSTSTPPPFIHEESRPLFASTNSFTTASFRIDRKRFEELEDAGKGVTMETIVCDICLCVGHARWTCRLLKVPPLPEDSTNSEGRRANHNSGVAQCEHCGAWDKHFSGACPELPTGQVSRKDYNWRKLPRTAPTTTAAARISSAPPRPIKTNCYHCSGTEHFGDDCPFLPPLLHPGIFSLSGVNDGDYASQEWLCEKQDLLAELEGKKQKPAYGRAVRPGDYDASEEFDPFREYKALEREKDRARRKDTDGRGEMVMGRRRPGERSPPPRPSHHRSEHSEFDGYRGRGGGRGGGRDWERDRDRERYNRRSGSPPVGRAAGTYYPSSAPSGPSARYGYRGGEYPRFPPPSTSARHPVPSRPPPTQNQARPGGAGRGGNSAGIGRGGSGRVSPLSSSGKRGGRGRGSK